MRLITARAADRDRLGAILPGDPHLFLDVAAAAALRGQPAAGTESMLALVEGGDRALDAVAGLLADPPAEAVIPLASVALRAPLPSPRRLRDSSLFIEHLEVGIQRLAAMEAAGADDPEARYAELIASEYRLPEIYYQRILYYQGDPIFTSGHEEEIVWPAGSTSPDFELEWAAVVGRGGANVAPETAHRHLFGYTIFNDWTARDVQMELMAQGLGFSEAKDFAGSNGFGPCLVTTDELSDVRDLTMRARVNGEEWAVGSTGRMRSTFEDAVVQLSTQGPLVPGEIIGSGTVVGGCGFDHGRALADGDEVELEVEGIGILRNRIRLGAHRG